MKEIVVARKEQINNIKCLIAEVGTKSIEICKEVYNLFKDCTREESIELTEYFSNELNLSRPSITQMKKAGENYFLYPMLDNMSHTKIVEIYPINETDITLDDLVLYSCGTNDIEMFKSLSQKEIRKNVKEILKVEDVEDVEDVTKEEKMSFFKYLIETYDIEKSDSDTLKYYMGV